MSVFMCQSKCIHPECGHIYRRNKVVKFIVTYGNNNIFSLEVPSIYNHKGELDMATMVKHVQSIVGPEAKFQVV